MINLTGLRTKCGSISIFLVLFSFLGYGQVKTAFTPRYSSTINGDVTIIANNVLSRSATDSYTGTEGNHEFTDNVFVDIDSDPTTFNSSSANFTNPEPAVGCLNYLSAYLYWSASDQEYLVNGTEVVVGDGGSEPNWNFNQVKLMLPGQTSYSTLTADDIIYRDRDGDDSFENAPYVCVKDITSLIQGLSDQFGKYQVANVKATEGRIWTESGGRIGTAGGWQIVFVYENPDLIGKNITLFDGYVNITSSSSDGGVDNEDFSFSGFQTVPNGEVLADVVLGALEGDFDIAGDQLQIQNTSGVWTDLSTSQRGSTNFFNSKITKDGSNFIDRNPASTNTLGFDAGLFPLGNSGNNLIGNNQTSANFRITTTQETYGVYLLGLSVAVYEPDLGALELDTRTGDTAYNPGDLVPFSVELDNNGNDAIQDLQIQMTIPQEVDFDAPSNLPAGVTFNYNSTTRVLTFNVADGLTDPDDTSYTIDFNLRVKDQCYFLESACSGSFQLQASATYRGTINTDLVTTNSSGTLDECGTGNTDPTVLTINSPDQVNWSTPADALNRTISCTDSAALAAAQALVPDTEFCSFTLNEVSGTFVPEAGCAVEGTYTNTFTFTDACGRVSQTFTQIITIEDTNDPSFNEALPQDTVAAFDNIPSPETLTASDSCDNNPTVDFVESYIGDNTSTSYTIVRTWTASDCAGNTVEHVQNIFVSPDGDPIGLSINDITVNENDGTAILTITHIGSVSGGFTLNYATANGSAVQPQDYTQQSSVISFTGTNGETRDITILITNDDVIEGVENFTVQLSAGTNTPSINDGSGQVTINDDDTAPGSGVGFDAVDYTFNEDVGTVTFTVTLVGNVSEAFTVDFATDDRLAIAGQDYEAQAGTLSFDGNDGETESITITIIDDDIIENQEHFVIDLSNISTDLIGITDSRERGDILDNDADPGVTGLAFDPTEVTVNEGDGTATFNVVLTGNFPQAFTVDFATSDGSATAGDDYTAQTGQLNFDGNDGEVRTITIDILEDDIIEATEDYTLTLSNPSLALVAINTANATGNI
ncbi:Calx-beta domain-containing protein, partial [Croceivirga thetidis]